MMKKGDLASSQNCINSIANILKSILPFFRPPLRSLDDVVKPGDSLGTRIVQFFDLDLLRDPFYLNISMGLTIAYVGEMSFSLMLPFILDDRGLHTKQIAIFMSVLAGADIASRLVSPFVGHRVKSKVRIVYLIGLSSGIIIRICKCF